jgi:hypothetical protein
MVLQVWKIEHDNVHIDMEKIVDIYGNFVLQISNANISRDGMNIYFMDDIKNC